MHDVDEKRIQHFDCKTSQEEIPFVKSQHHNIKLYLCTPENGLLSALKRMKQTSGRSCIVSWIAVVGLMVNQSAPTSDTQNTTLDSPSCDRDANDEKAKEKRKEMQSL